MWTKQELAEKVDDEGGWTGFFMWGGLRDENVPEDIRLEWDEAKYAWRDFVVAINRINAKLPKL